MELFVNTTNHFCKSFSPGGLQPNYLAGWLWPSVLKSNVHVFKTNFCSYQDLFNKKWRKVTSSGSLDCSGVSWQTISHGRLQVWFTCLYSCNLLWSIKSIFISWWTRKNGHRKISSPQRLKFGELEFILVYGCRLLPV